MAMGHPLEEPLKIYPVSDLVNSPFGCASWLASSAF
jgi:hypothetical protein